MSHLLLTPPIALIVYVGLVGILALVGRWLAGRVEEEPLGGRSMPVAKRRQGTWPCPATVSLLSSLCSSAFAPGCTGARERGSDLDSGGLRGRPGLRPGGADLGLSAGDVNRVEDERGVRLKCRIHYM